MDWANRERSSVIPHSSDMTKLYSSALYAHRANELIESCNSEQLARQRASGKALILVEFADDIEFDLVHVQDTLIDQKLNYNYDENDCKYTGHTCFDWRNVCVLLALHSKTMPDATREMER
ncbi:hypothetical protein Ciccas_012554 [Cichlidogyrus casuarinus]|uniref:Uncharacterized protein n=1 Tax=Cichlidogyrus casuarinus TaxID=1844966 RepID=A0ABD2PP97_9PLAT